MQSIPFANCSMVCNVQYGSKLDINHGTSVLSAIFGLKLPKAKYFLEIVL